MRLFILFLALASVSLCQGRIQFDNYRVYRTTPHNAKQLNLIRKLQNDIKYNFWTEPGHVGQDVDIMVPPNLVDEFVSFLNHNQINSTIFMSNVQEHVDRERFQMDSARADDKFNFETYHTLDEINSWLESLTVQYPSQVKLIKAGLSYEKRDLLGIHISFSAKNAKNAIFIEGNIHAREWISSATVIYMVNELLTSKDPQVRELAERYDWYVAPVVNPDGFVYSHTKDRTWRKNRNPSSDKNCIGTDPNRNWDWHWNEGGASRQACAETYNGDYAFSDAEVLSMSQYLTSIGENLVGYVSFHSYSQLLMFPYGYTNKHLDNYDQMLRFAKAGAQSLAKRYGTKYQYGNIVDTIYVASGGSVDWAKGALKLPVVVVYELRDTGRYGFMLPENQIKPTSEETLDSLITIFDTYESENNK